MIHIKKDHLLKNFKIEPIKHEVNGMLSYIFKQLTITERTLLKRFSILPFFQVYTYFKNGDDYSNGKYASCKLSSENVIKAAELLQKFINRELDGKIRININKDRFTLYIRDNFYNDVINLINKL